MKRLYAIPFFLLMISSCVFPRRNGVNSNIDAQQDIPRLNATIDNGFLRIIVADLQNYHDVVFNLNDIVSVRKSIKTINVVDIQSEFEKAEGIDHLYKAYSIAQNNGSIKVDISIDGVKDTTIYMPVLLFNRSISFGTASPAAKLQSPNGEHDIEAETRSWVYRTLKSNIGDSTITKIATYSRALQRPDTTVLVVNEPIPVFNNLSSVNFRVSSSLKADHYYLLACRDDDALDKAIEYYISHKFEGAVNSISSSIKCHSLKNQEGLMCVFLVGINDDWSSTCVPCGAICIDHSSPEFVFGTTESGATRFEYFGSITFAKRKIKLSSLHIPYYTGSWYVDTGDFEGWNPFKVPYTIKWSGDVEKIIIHTGNGVKQTVNVLNKRSPYHTTFSTYLHTGDNYIKVEAVDKAGNVSQNEVFVSIGRVKDDTPQINNDINIWN